MEVSGKNINEPNVSARSQPTLAGAFFQASTTLSGRGVGGPLFSGGAASPVMAQAASRASAAVRGVRPAVLLFAAIIELPYHERRNGPATESTSDVGQRITARGNGPFAGRPRR